MEIETEKTEAPSIDKVLAAKTKPKTQATFKHHRSAHSMRPDGRAHAICNIRLIDEGALTTTGEDVTCKTCLGQLQRATLHPAPSPAKKKPAAKAARKKSGRDPSSNKSLAAKMTPARAPSPDPEHKALAFAELARGIVDRDYLAELLAGDVTGCEPFDLTEEEAAELGQLVHLEQKLSRRARRLAEAVIKAVRA